MSKNDVIKKLSFLAVIGAVIGALLVFLKKHSEEAEDLFEDDDIFEDDDVEEASCPGCQKVERNYTTISKENEETEEEVAEEIEDSEEE